jgi:hypothetical protein
VILPPKPSFGFGAEVLSRAFEGWATGVPPLVKVCSQCGEENPDRFRLCGHCGTPFAVSEPL